MSRRSKVPSQPTASPREANQGVPLDRPRILLVIAGGIAAYKAPELVRSLVRRDYSVRCAMTEAAGHFVAPMALEAVSGNRVRSDLFDLEQEGQIDHIRLADECELVVVAPATANSLAKMAHGLADDLVSTLLLATRAPVLVAPAMNVNMWEHPATQANLETLRERGVHVVGPDSGFLACGWEGAGRMADPEAIADAADSLLAPDTMIGEAVVVTAGGTREAIDPVRTLTNRSSGKMGFAIAAAAARRGADVTLVAGPCALPTPTGVKRIDVESALEMRDAVRQVLDRCTVFIGAAAVADFRPAQAADHKIKKDDAGEHLSLDLVRTPDILSEVSSRADLGRIVVGFAAESRDLVAAARRKLERKRCDLIVANDISRSEIGFESDQNAVTFVAADGSAEELAIAPKGRVAAALLDRVEALRRGRGDGTS